MRSGKTPLLRARKLEKMFNVGEIYIKLEGQNPSGHKHDRIAEVLIKDAIAHNYKRIIANGSISYINSLLYYANLEKVEVLIPIFKNEKWKTTKFKNHNLIDFRDLKNPSKLELLVDLANEKNSYLAAEGYTNTHISQMVLEQLTDELIIKMNYNVDTIFTQLGYGYTLTSIYNSLLKKWMNGSIEKFPVVSCGTWDKGNQVYNHYLEFNQVKSSMIESVDPEAIPMNHLFLDKSFMQETLQAVSETNGEIVSLNDEELKNASKLIRKTEHIKVNHQESYPLAAFIKLVENRKIQNGKHVIILNEGKSIVKIDDINDFDEVSKDNLVEFTRNWLAQYSDSALETEEAIKNAMDKGHIILASRNGEYEGVCIIVNLGFEEFIPKYHLAYIGTNSSSKGRGVGSELIKRAIELTDGNISLHVDLDNKGAKKLYEKYGFKHVYNRMIYYGEE